MNATMQAIIAQDYGGSEVLKLERVPRPTPKANQVLVRIYSAGVNPADWKYRAGMFKQFMPLTFPWTPGLEGAGIVESIGTEVKMYKPGQRVYGPINRSYAEYALATEQELFAIPSHLSFDQAASVPLGALTAWQAVIEEAEVQAGQHVLVHGGAGGVGMYAIQLARWKGARVTATASAANVNFVKSLGAEKVIDYQSAKFEDVVHDVDAVIDTVGGDLIARSLPVIKSGGIFVTVAGRVDPEMGQARGIQATSARRADVIKLEQITTLLETKKLVSGVGKVFSLSQAVQAHQLSETGHGRGRIILHIAD